MRARGKKIRNALAIGAIITVTGLAASSIALFFTGGAANSGWLSNSMIVMVYPGFIGAQVIIPGIDGSGVAIASRLALMLLLNTIFYAGLTLAMQRLFAKFFSASSKLS